MSALGLARDITDEEVRLELAIVKFVEGNDHIKASQLAERLDTSSKVIGGVLSKTDREWPLEDTGFESDYGTAYRITLGEDRE